MKEKTWGLKTSIIVFLASISLFSLFYFYRCSCVPQNLREYLVMIFSGATASALVTLLIYSAEYKIAKVSALENYWQEALKVLGSLGKLEYYHLDVPLQVLKDYYQEQTHNKFVDSVVEQIPADNPLLNDEFFQYRHDARDRWCERIASESDNMRNRMGEIEYKNIIIQEVERAAKTYLEKLHKVIDRYISLSETSSGEVENAIGRIEYFTGKRQRKKLLQTIHEPIRDILEKVQLGANHFNLYRSGESNNIPVVLDTLMELQKLFFVDEVNEKSKALCIYRSFYDDMNEQLEKFRASIYNKEPIPEKRHPVRTYYR